MLLFTILAFALVRCGYGDAPATLSPLNIGVDPTESLDQSMSMKGVHLRIVTVEDPPFVGVREGDVFDKTRAIMPATAWHGWIIRIIQKAARMGGFTYNLTLSTHKNTFAYGQAVLDVTKQRCKDADGVVTEGQTSCPHSEYWGPNQAPPNVYFAGAYITPPRLSASLMTAPFATSPLSLLCKAQDAEWTQRMFTFAKPFSVRLWILTIGFILTTGAAYHMVDPSSIDFEHRAGTWNEAASNWGRGTLLAFNNLQGGAGFNPDTAPGRLVAVAWVVMALGLSCGFTAELVAYLTKTQLSFGTETTFAQFVAQQHPVCVLGGSAYGGWMSRHPEYQKLPQVPCAGMKEMVTQLAAGKCMGVVERKSHVQFMQDGGAFCAEQQGNYFRLTDEMTDGPQAIGVGLKSDMHDVLPKLSYWVTKARRSGEVGAMYTHTVSRGGCRTKYDNVRPVGTADIAGALFAFIFAVFLSLFLKFRDRIRDQQRVQKHGTLGDYMYNTAGFIEMTRHVNTVCKNLLVFPNLMKLLHADTHSKLRGDHQSSSHAGLGEVGEIERMNVDAMIMTKYMLSSDMREKIFEPVLMYIKGHHLLSQEISPLTWSYGHKTICHMVTQHKLKISYEQQINDPDTAPEDKVKILANYAKRKLDLVSESSVQVMLDKQCEHLRVVLTQWWIDQAREVYYKRVSSSRHKKSCAHGCLVRAARVEHEITSSLAFSRRDNLMKKNPSATEAKTRNPLAGTPRTLGDGEDEEAARNDTVSAAIRKSKQDALQKRTFRRMHAWVKKKQMVETRAVAHKAWKHAAALASVMGHLEHDSTHRVSTDHIHNGPPPPSTPDKKAREVELAHRGNGNGKDGGGRRSRRLTGSATNDLTQEKKENREGTWQVKTDPTSHATYYYNPTTKESTWTKPEALQTGKLLPKKDKPNRVTSTAPRLFMSVDELTDFLVLHKPKKSKAELRKEAANMLDVENMVQLYASLQREFGEVPKALTRSLEHVKDERYTAADNVKVDKFVSGDAPLPPNWVKMQDETKPNNPPYYYNSKTKNSQWTRPTA